MQKTFKSFEDLPLTLNVKEVSEVLGISRANAYNLINSTSFPTIHIGKRLIVPKDRFIDWLNKQSQSTDF